MSSLRRVAVLAAALLLAGCGSSSPSAVPSAVASAAARASIAVPAGTIPPKGSAGIVAPVQAGQTLTVLNGYDNPMPGGTCTKGYGHDHCTNQQYGLDLVPSNPSDLLVLAPVSGKIAWTDVSSSGGGCLGIVPTAFPQLNLTVCHLSEQRATGAVSAGQVLGLRRPANGWVHLSLDVRADANGPLPKEKWTVGVPFSGAFTIAGKDFPPNASPTGDLHRCETLTSSTTATGNTALPNPLPAVTPASLSACGVAVGPTPTPTPVAPVLSGTWVAPKDGAKLTTSKLALSAKPAASLAHVKVTKVAYTVKWGSNKPKAACTATRAGSDGAWSCTADLWKLGAPLGKLTLSFDVFDDAGDLVRSPAGTRTVTFAAPPPAPTGVVVRRVQGSLHGCGGGGQCEYFQVTWNWTGNGTAVDASVWWDGGLVECEPGCGTPAPGDPCLGLRHKDVPVDKGAVKLESSAFDPGGFRVMAVDKFGHSACRFAKEGSDIAGAPNPPSDGLVGHPTGSLPLVDLVWSHDGDHVKGFHIYGRYDPAWAAANGDRLHPSACKATNLIASVGADARETMLDGHGRSNWTADYRYTKWCFTVAAYNVHGESKHVTMVFVEAGTP